MKNYLNKIKQFITSHKKISIAILIVLVLTGYWGYKKITNTSGETRYVTAKVEKNTIISSITGTGQVSASNQIDLKSKASGDIVYIAVRSGQKVSSGSLVAQLDTKESQKSIRDAEANLESAKLALEKLKTQSSDENMNADLAKAYEDGFNTVSNAFSDLPTSMTELENLLGYQNLSENTARVSGNIAKEYRDKAETSYYTAKNAFEKNRNSFRVLDRNSQTKDIDALINETYETTKTTTDAIKNMRNFVDYIAEDSGRESDYSSYKTTLTTQTNTINQDLTNLLSAKNSIKTYKDAFVNTNFDIKSSVLSVQQKENALQDAKDTLADYFIRAPFDGTISSVSIKKTDSVSSGTIVATLITDKQVAEISLNEVDAAKIKIGQKTTLTFDAVSYLTISGEVVEVDSIGTVSSGVVNYTVKINFDTNDSRIKPGMSVSATIITDIKQDVLSISNSAIKSTSNKSFVETFDKKLPPSTTGVQGSTSENLPIKKEVTTGISNDTMTEIISGLNEGDIVVIKTITGTNTASTKTTSTKSILGQMSSGRPRD